MKLKILIMLSLIFIFGCKCNKTSTEMASKNFESVLIAKGNLYGAGAEGIEKQNLVITNKNDWNALLTQLDTTNKVSQSFTETDIDFNKFTVIAIFESVKGSGGHKIAVDILETSEQKIITVKPYITKGKCNECNDATLLYC